MKVEIITILDHSGSMASLRDDVIGGYNTFIAEQQALPGEARATLIQFNHIVKLVDQGVPLADVRPLTRDTYAPVGSTALYDAIGSTLEREGERIARENWADKVLVNIITDGQNNCSTKYTREQVKEMIKHAEDKAGWVILFQAANQDAFAAGQQYGISAASTRSFEASASGMAVAYDTMSTVATTLRTAP